MAAMNYCNGSLHKHKKI